MSADELVSRLEKAKSTGRGSWIARCPAHADKNPSLTIREADDGRVLAHCFAGCSIENILSAVGLEFDALFPEKPITGHNAVPARLRFNPRHVLSALSDEILIVELAANDIANGKPVSDGDRSRLTLAAARIAQAREMIDGR